MLGYPWTQNDAGRAESKRPKQKNDCTVIAYALAFHFSYDDAYDILRAAGRKSHRSLNFSGLMDIKAALGELERQTFPAVKGQRRMNPVTFCERFASGTYVVFTAKHVFAVIDGVVHDTFQSRDDRCIYRAYRVVAKSQS